MRSNLKRFAASLGSLFFVFSCASCNKKNSDSTPVLANGSSVSNFLDEKGADRRDSTPVFPNGAAYDTFFDGKGELMFDLNKIIPGENKSKLVVHHSYEMLKNEDDLRIIKMTKPIKISSLIDFPVEVQEALEKENLSFVKQLETSFDYTMPLGVFFMQGTNWFMLGNSENIDFKGKSEAEILELVKNKERELRELKTQFDERVAKIGAAKFEEKIKEFKHRAFVEFGGNKFYYLDEEATEFPAASANPKADFEIK